MKANTLMGIKEKVRSLILSLLIKLSQVSPRGCRPSLGRTILNPRVIISIFYLGITSLLYNSFSFAYITYC